MPSPPLDAQTALLTRLYVTALSIVALLSIGGQALVQNTLLQQQNDATVVNVAGRQRMLSQKIVKTALMLSSAESPAARSEAVTNLESLLSQWHLSHLALQEGVTEPQRPRENSPDIRLLFSELDPIHTAMCDAGQRIVSAYRDADFSAAQATSEPISVLLKLDPRFLDQMEKIVTQFDREATARVMQLRRIELALLALTLLVLMVEGIYIFRPAVQSLQAAAASLIASQAAQQAAQEQAEQANNEKTRFLANISHDLRTPLHAVRGYTELLQSTSLNVDQQTKLAIIQDAAETLTALADDLLDLARIDAGKLEVKLESVSPHEVITACLNLVNGMAAEQHLLLRFAPPPELANVHVLADPLRLRQILINLLTNAVKFTNAGFVEVRLALAATGQRVRIMVDDSGVGISPTDHQRVFEAFQQLETGSQARAGAGLGLAICKRLAEAMDGSLAVESSPGVGSTFTLEISRAEDIEIQPAAVMPDKMHMAQATRPIARSLTVLIVDDDAVNRRLLQDIMLSWQHQPIVMSDGAAAIEYAAEHPIDIALLDLQMPTMSGRELAERLRAMFHDSSIRSFPIWAVSATRLSSAEEDAHLFDAYLLKPISLAEIKTRLESVEVRSEDRMERVLQRLQGNRALLRSLIELFLESWPTNKAAWDEAIHSQNAQEVRKLLHLWRGRVSQFDGTDVLEYIHRWEQSSTDQALFSVIESQEKQFEQTFVRLLDHLREILPNDQ